MSLEVFSLPNPGWSYLEARPPPLYVHTHITSFLPKYFSWSTALKEFWQTVSSNTYFFQVFKNFCHEMSAK